MSHEFWEEFLGVVVFAMFIIVPIMVAAWAERK